ncbi:hypothetical protein BKA56DRAFT_580164, partial [Ilyonectria sp. MPI-CAGE-AT-0026]
MDRSAQTSANPPLEMGHSTQTSANPPLNMDPSTQTSYAADNLQSGPTVNSVPPQSSEGYMSSSQPGAPPIVACTPVHYPPVELLDSQASPQPVQPLSSEQKNGIISFLTVFVLILIFYEVL